MTSTLLHPNNTDVMLVPMVMKVLSVKDVQMVTMGILSLLVTTASHVDVTLMRTSVIHDLLHPNNTDVMLVPMVMKVLSVKDVQMVTMGILSLLVTTASHVDVTLMRTSVIHDTVITLLVNV